MGNCCSGAGNSVVIKGGDRFYVTGSGTVSDPYIINGSLELSVKAAETATVRMAIVGLGSIADPYVLSADATVSVNDLTDVNDGTPAILGDVLLYDGSNWVYGPPPTQAPGQVNTAGGIQGDGTLSTPIEVKVSEAIIDADTGLYTYIDANGELRAEVRVTPPAWTSVTGKPIAFPPSAHTHPNADLTGMHDGTTAPGSGLGINGDYYLQYV